MRWNETDGDKFKDPLFTNRIVSLFNTLPWIVWYCYSTKSLNMQRLHKFNYWIQRVSYFTPNLLWCHKIELIHTHVKLRFAVSTEKRSPSPDQCENSLNVRLIQHSEGQTSKWTKCKIQLLRGGGLEEEILLRPCCCIKSFLTNKREERFLVFGLI